MSIRAQSTPPALIMQTILNAYVRRIGQVSTARTQLMCALASHAAMQVYA